MIQTSKGMALKIKVKSNKMGTGLPSESVIFFKKICTLVTLQSINKATSTTPVLGHPFFTNVTNCMFDLIVVCVCCGFRPSHHSL